MNRRAAVPVWLQLARLSCLSRHSRFYRLVHLPGLPRLVRLARFARLVACLAAAVTTAAMLSASAAAAPAAPPRVTARPASGAICDSGTAITLIGVDTAAGQMLFAVAGPGGGAGSWIVELDGAGREAHAYPDKPGARFAGSVGPGPVVAVEACGSGCLQPVRWNHGAWQPLGEPVTLPAASTVAATYDAAGAPWLVAHGAGTQAGQVQTWSFRYEGRQWKSRGGLAVTAVGQP